MSDISDWMGRLRAALFDSVTEKDVAEIARSLAERAKGGDIQATRLLFSYILGSPNATEPNVHVQTAVHVQAAGPRLMNGHSVTPVDPTEPEPAERKRIEDAVAKLREEKQKKARAGARP